jgi:hypothetical protein
MLSLWEHAQSAEVSLPGISWQHFCEPTPDINDVPVGIELPKNQL